MTTLERTEEMRRLISVVLLAATIGIGSQTAFADVTEIPGYVPKEAPRISTSTTSDSSGVDSTGAVESPGIVEILTVALTLS